MSKLHPPWKSFLRGLRNGTAALCGPILLVLNFFIGRTDYPHNDSAAYFLITQDRWRLFTEGFSVESLAHLYFERDWKPISHTIALLPFLFFANGDVRFAIALIGCGLFAGLLIYLYLMQRLFITPLAAIAATAYIGTIPWVYEMALKTQTELTSGLAIVAALYHLMRSQNFARRAQSYISALWMGFALTLRPDAALICLAPPLLVTLWNSIPRKSLPFRALAGLLLVPVCALIFGQVAFLMADGATAFQRLIPGVISGFCLLSALQVGLARKYRLTVQAIVLVIVVGIPFLWFIPSVPMLVMWPWMCTYGEMAMKTGGSQPFSGTVLFSLLVSRSFPFIAAISILFIADRRHGHHGFGWIWREPLGRWLVCAVVAVLMLAVIESLSYSAELRYYTVPLLLALTLLWAQNFRLLAESGRWRLVILLSLGMCFQIAIGVISNERNGRFWRQDVVEFLNLKGFGQIRSPIAAMAESPTSELIDGLMAEIPRERTARILFVARNYSVHFDAWSLELAARERTSKWKIEFHDFDVTAVPIDVQLRSLALCQCYVLIGPTEGEPELVWHPSMAGVANLLLGPEMQSVLTQRGWTHVKDIVVGAIGDQPKKSTFRLIKIGTF